MSVGRFIVAMATNVSLIWREDHASIQDYCQAIHASARRSTDDFSSANLRKVKKMGLNGDKQHFSEKEDVGNVSIAHVGL